MSRRREVAADTRAPGTRLAHVLEVGLQARMQAARLTPFPKAAPVEGKKDNASLPKRDPPSTGPLRTITKVKGDRAGGGDAGDGVPSAFEAYDAAMRAEERDLRTYWRDRQYYLEPTDDVVLPTVGYRYEIPREHQYRYLWVRDWSNDYRVTGVLMDFFNLQLIEQTEIHFNLHRIQDPRMPPSITDVKKTILKTKTVDDNDEASWRPIFRAVETADASNWRGIVDMLQKLIDDESSLTTRYRAVATEYTELASIYFDRNHLEQEEDAKGTAKRFTDKLIAQQALVEKLEAAKQRLERIYGSASPMDDKVQHAIFYITNRTGYMPYRKTVSFTLSSTYEDGRLQMTQEDMRAVWEKLTEITGIHRMRIIDNFEKRVIFDAPAYQKDPSAAEPHMKFLKEVLEKHWDKIWGPVFVLSS